MIKLESVTKRYGKLTALENVSLDVSKGEYLALLGPNGAGKTTIIRILLDFTRPESGKAFIKGISCRLPEAREGVGYLPENIRIPLYLSGRDFLRRQAYLCSLHGKAAENAIDRALELTGMRVHQKNRAGTYSKGMIQRIGLSAALLCSPDLLILDEPVNGLDPIGIREFRVILEDLKSQKMTLLLNSHILSEVERLCSSAMILNHGKVLASGPISSLVREGETLEDVFVRLVK